MPCTAFLLSTEDGKHLLARTLDYNGDYGASLLFVPGGLAHPLALDDKALPTRLPYSLLGMGVLAGGRTPHMLDGVNEHGLCGVCNEYPGYAHCAGPVSGRVSLAPTMAVLFVLGSCKSLDEAQDAFTGRASLVEAASPAIGSVPPLHYMFTDALGGCMVVEPEADGIKIYRDTVGVLANTPPYPWQETNLRNHLGLLRRERVAPAEIAGKSLATNSGNANLLGLPGDFTSASRFVRAAYLRELALPAGNEEEGVTLAAHILDSLSAVKGWCAPTPQGRWLHTVYASVMCAESRSYYFSHYNDRRLARARLQDHAPGAQEIVSYEWSRRQSIAVLGKNRESGE
jgi:choloylglycine hydrolase